MNSFWQGAFLGLASGAAAVAFIVSVAFVGERSRETRERLEELYPRWKRGRR